MIFFLCGVCVGGFIAKVSYRLENNINKNFFCDNCKISLLISSFIPIFGYLINKGKEKIHIRNTFIEIICGLFFFMEVNFNGINKTTVEILIVFSILLFSSITDIYNMEIYILPPIILTLVIFILNISVYRLIVICILAILYLIINKYKFPFGEGDVIIFAMCFMSIEINKWLTLLIFTFMLASVFSIILIILKVCSKKDFIPLVPFILIGYIIVCIL